LDGRSEFFVGASTVLELLLLLVLLFLVLWAVLPTFLELGSEAAMSAHVTDFDVGL
jgi:hypothetical protein